jgi:Zn-dependent protease
MAIVLARHRRGRTVDRVIWRTWLHLGASQRVELSVHLYLVLTLVAITWLLGQAILPNVFPHWSALTCWLVAAGIAFFDGIAGLAHELGHAIVATARGRHVYRITLYGLAAAARRSGGPNCPRDQFSIALAGPVGQLLLASALLVAWRITPADNEALRVAIGLPAISNLVMGAMNLLPFRPLDGGRVAHALLAVTIRSNRL